ncbi:hypothetical protein ACLOJK_039114 [Asimina triloba]
MLREKIQEYDGFLYKEDEVESILSFALSQDSDVQFEEQGDSKKQRFLKKYVRKYVMGIPYLMKAYEGKLELKWLDAKADEAKLG